MLGADAARYGPRFTSKLKGRINEIGAGLSGALKMLKPGHLAQRDPTAPCVAIYFGNDTCFDEAEVEVLVAAAVPILPVVRDLDHYSASVPAGLHPINGIELDPAAPDLEVLVNLVLENLALLRRTRRLFLSYRRLESTAVSQQLRVAFDDIGYDAFLDTNSVPKGDDFQAVLWHRLLDSDVMVVLDTQDFLGSRYTCLEIANASAMSVGILQVLWPGVQRSPYSLLATPFQLSLADFEGERLTDDAIKRITDATEALRARCQAARHTNLVVEFCAEARRIGATVSVQPERYVLANVRGKRIAVIPAVGVPDAQRYHEASGRFAVDGMDVDEALLIYDHRGMLPQWTKFLDWLDDFLPVKGLRVTDTAIRLGAS
jgi:hypothetical protein